MPKTAKDSTTFSASPEEAWIWEQRKDLNEDVDREWKSPMRTAPRTPWQAHPATATAQKFTLFAIFAAVVTKSPPQPAPTKPPARQRWRPDQIPTIAELLTPVLTFALKRTWQDTRRRGRGCSGDAGGIGRCRWRVPSMVLPKTLPEMTEPQRSQLQKAVLLNALSQKTEPLTSLPQKTALQRTESPKTALLTNLRRMTSPPSYQLRKSLLQKNSSAKMIALHRSFEAHWK
ncbi:hypothetical protein ACEQ8H_008555 [Pleosporales sp. CAS-2024a]